MNTFYKAAAEFTFVATIMMGIIIMLFIGIFVMLAKERNDRIRQNKRVIHDVGITNRIFEKIAKTLGINIEDETDNNNIK